MTTRQLIATFLSVFFISSNALSQEQICLGEDYTLCEGQSVVIENCTDENNPSINVIELDNPSEVSLTDDIWSGVIDIGFNFEFYGNSYNQCIIGSNCLVSFDLSKAGSYCSWQIEGAGPMPSTNLPDAQNSFMPAYQDINPNLGGQILYQTIGVAPNRKFIVLYLDLYFFSCDQICNYIALILNEGSNVLESHLGDKPICSDWGGGVAIQGTQNANGTSAHITPGRNNSQWTTNQEGKSWVPTSPTNTNNYTINDIPYSSITATGTNYSWEDTEGTIYNNAPLSELTVTASENDSIGYFISGTACEASLGAVSDTTWIYTATPELSTSSTDDICGQGIGSVTATPGPGSPGPYSYSWPALGASTQTVSNVYPGTYLVYMVDGNGCTSDATVIVGDNPAAFSATSTLVGCTGGTDGTATAMITPSDGSETFLWSNGQTSATATNLIAGDYTCQISTSTGCIGNITVTINEIPSMILSITDQNDASCNSLNNGMIQVGVSQGTPPFSYSWNQSACTTNEAIDLLAGTHIITITDSNGCSDEISATISEPDSLNISDLTPDSMICADAFITLEAVGIGGSSPYIFQWSANGLNLDVGQTITVNPAANNNEYCVTLSEECGSPETSKCLSITFPNNITPVITPDVEIQCVPGDFIIYNNTAESIDVGTTEYTVSNGDIYITNGTDSIECTFESPGTYDFFVTIISNYGCTYTSSFDNLITVTPPPIADFTLSKNPATWFETEIQTTEACIGNIVDFQWFSPNATSMISNEGSAIITYPEGISASYPITLIATTNEGCSDIKTIEVEIIPDVIFYAPNSFTPDDDEHNQTWTIFVEGIDFQNFTLEIFNKWGETIWETHDINAEWDGTYNNGIVPQGTYIWRAIYKERENDGRKIHTGYVNVIR